VGRARELTGKFNDEIAQLIVDGYLSFQMVAIRRLGDPKRDVSLRRVLMEIKDKSLLSRIIGPIL